MTSASHSLCRGPWACAEPGAVSLTQGVSVTRLSRWQVPLGCSFQPCAVEGRAKVVDTSSEMGSCTLHVEALPSAGLTLPGPRLWSRVRPSACFLPSSCPWSRPAVAAAPFPASLALNFLHFQFFLAASLRWTRVRAEGPRFPQELLSEQGNWG